MKGNIMNASKLFWTCVSMLSLVMFCTGVYGDGCDDWCDNEWIPQCEVGYETGFFITQEFWLKAYCESWWDNPIGWDGGQILHTMKIWIYGPDNTCVAYKEAVLENEEAYFELLYRPVKTGTYTAKFYYQCYASWDENCTCEWDSDEFSESRTQYFTVKDSDRDGLSDYAEVYIYGTDRYKYDSDGDWFSDRQEVYYNGNSDYKPGVSDTNARKRDTDGDGYCDGHEVNLGRNPLSTASHPGETSKLVINEILYDWPGADLGYEFIELYNNQNVSVNLSGYSIQASDIDGFKTILGIPSGKVIAPNSYFLIGGTKVKDINGKLPDIVANITMQNANNPGKIYGTDGVRLVKPGGYVLDTVLYGQPNYSLFGDDSYPGQTYELCPDVAAGHSLSRKVAGGDTNRKEDWVDLAKPSPTSSVSGDSDNDGLSNADEAAWGTNPLDPDTDKDGYFDGSEVNVGTDPKNAASRPRVVINEVYYDPPGADEVKKQEFIELYNPEAKPVDISRCFIQYGGAGFGTGAVGFPMGTVIPAGSYYLIGESNVQSTFGVRPNLILEGGLHMQNGDQNDPAVPFYGKGSPTDGVRLVGYRGKVLDTVLYDTPNSAKLPGDASNPAGPNELCPDVLPGYSLSRLTSGVDTNKNTDWIANAPSPGGKAPEVTAWCSPTAQGKIANDWGYPERAFLQDDSGAIATDEEQDYYQFNIPLVADAKIVGIEIAVRGRNLEQTSNGITLYLAWDGAGEYGYWSEDRRNTFSSSSYAWKYYGAPADLWGRTNWQVSDLSNAKFICAGGASGNVEVDVIKIRVYYKR